MGYRRTTRHHLPRPAEPRAKEHALVWVYLSRQVVVQSSSANHTIPICTASVATTPVSKVCFVFEVN